MDLDFFLVHPTVGQYLRTTHDIPYSLTLALAFDLTDVLCVWNCDNYFTYNGCNFFLRA